MPGPAWNGDAKAAPAPRACAGNAKAPKPRIAVTVRRPIAKGIVVSRACTEAEFMKPVSGDHARPDHGKGACASGAPARPPESLLPAASWVIHRRGRGQQGWGNLQF